jgi:protein O-GlcNAc transferase
MTKTSPGRQAPSPTTVGGGSGAGNARPAENLAVLLAEAVRLHQAEKLAEAKPLYERVLALNPRQPDALHLLGLVAHQTGNHAGGAELIRKAIRQNDRVAPYHNSLGECWRGMGEWDKAVTCYRRVLRLDPRSADALANLGTVLKNQGKFAKAIEHYRRAMKLRPDDPRDWANLGSAWCEWGRYPEAVEACRNAVRLAPRLFEGWMNLGIALRNLGQNQEAIEVLRRALALRPGEVNGLNHLGIALQRVGEWREAVEALQQAVRRQPEEPQTYLNLGNLWRERRDYDRAEKCYRKTLELTPDSADAWINLGLTAQAQGLLPEAVRRLERCLELNPKSAEAWTNLGVISTRMAEPEKAMECYRKARAIGATRDVAASNVNYAMQFCTQVSPTEIRAEAQSWGDAVLAARKVAASGGRPGRASGAVIRVGFVSGDFRAHPVAYFIHGLFAQHDRRKLDIFCYSVAPEEDDWTRRLRTLVGHWVPAAGLSDAELEAAIRKDDIDVLIDLAGHTAKHRLMVFAARPAYRQATYLGYPGSTGLRTVDFRVSDVMADPPGESKGHYVEQLMHLDRCAWCYKPPAQVEPLPTPPSSAGAPFTFGCFNNHAKISELLVASWARLLEAVPGSRLLLKESAYNGEEFRRIVRERFRRHGIDSDRLVLRGRTKTIEEHYVFYNQVDIALDTYPYHGTTTTCDALWMGVPVVSWKGDRHASRVGASLLQAVEHPELIAGGGEDYVRRAAELARDPHRLAELRRNLRERMCRSALMDSSGFARSFESALYRIVEAPVAGN